MTRPVRFFAILCSLSCAALAQSSVESFHALVLQTYDFTPHKLSRKEQEARSADLDTFWKTVESNPDSTVPHLRGELQRFDNPPFFLYDGAQLLLTLARSRSDSSIALRAIGHCDLRDVSPRFYLLSVHSFARTGFNTLDAAFRVLAESSFTAFIPQHYLTVSRDMALMFMLMPGPRENYLDSAIAFLRTSRDQRAVQDVAVLLWFTATPSADQALSDYQANASNPDTVRNLIGELIGTMPRIRNVEQLSEPDRASYASLLAARSTIMSRISDEAMHELVDSNRQIRSLFGRK